MQIQLLAAATLLSLWMIAGSHADVPATNPTSTATLGNGTISYTRPPMDWIFAETSSNDTRAAYADRASKAILALQVLPPDAQIDHGAALALCRQLKDAHKKRKDEMILEPTLETDKRFAIRIHEIYKHDGNVADELHLYRQVASRPCMMTVNAGSDDSADVQAAQAVAEEVLLSASFVKPIKKKAAKPS